MMSHGIIQPLKETEPDISITSEFRCTSHSCQVIKAVPVYQQIQEQQKMLRQNKSEQREFIQIQYLMLLLLVFSYFPCVKKQGKEAITITFFHQESEGNRRDIKLTHHVMTCHANYANQTEITNQWPLKTFSCYPSSIRYNFFI